MNLTKCVNENLISNTTTLVHTHECSACCLVAGEGCFRFVVIRQLCDKGYTYGGLSSIWLLPLSSLIRGAGSHAVATDRSHGYSSRLHLDRERRCEQHARHVGVDLGTVCRRAHPKAPLARRRDARAARVRMRQVLVMITSLIMTRNGPHASSPWASPRSGASATSRVRGPPCQSRARSDGARRAP